MDHLQISFGDDGSWKQRCGEKLEKLKEKDFTRREDEDADALQLRKFKEMYAIDDFIMDSEIYEAIKNGDPVKFVDVLEEVCEKEKLSHDDIFWQVSPGYDSLLHVAAKYGRDKIAELVASQYPDFLEERNIKDNIALHDAAQSISGGAKVIKVIFHQHDAWPGKRDEQITRSKNRVGNTALHEAVACGNLDGVIELYNKDKGVAHELNNSNKSPLYIAVYNYMRWNDKTAKGIVDCLLQDSLVNKPSPKWNSGQSPLHAATEAMSDKEREQRVPGSQFFVNIVRRVLPRCQIFDFAGAAPSSALLEELVEKRPEMIYLSDEYGRNPLHYAALCGYSDGVRILLKRYPKASLVYDKDGNLPIHLACKFGTIDVVKKLLPKGYTYPGLFPNQSGQNILHAAAMGGKHGIVDYILTISKYINININETDRDGNTPLHIASEKMHPMVLLYLTRDKRIDLQCQNRRGLMARDIVLQQSHQPMKYGEVLSYAILSSVNAHHSERGLKEIRPNYDISRMKDLMNTLMLVAILIATVTFAAGFTVPGNVYDPENDDREGTAVLVKKTVFQIFVICNTIAMYSSTLVVSFILLWARYGNYEALANNSFKIGLCMMALALITMSGAFMAATYLIVEKVSWIANLTVAIGIVPILLICKAYFLATFPLESSNLLFRPFSYIVFRILIPFVGSSDKVTSQQSSGYEVSNRDKNV